MKLLFSWLGDGGEAVNKKLSTKRAEICAGCKFNVKPSLLERILKNPFTKTIREVLALKSTMGIKTPFDSQLFFCSKCGCNTALKVHVPNEYIRAFTTDKQLSDLPRHCWIRKENL